MDKDYTFHEIVTLTQRVIKEFMNVEQKPWGIEGAMIELSKQQGELAKQVMMLEKYYMASRDDDPRYRASKEQIGDELADIFFGLVRVAMHYNIYLEKAILQARRDELRSLGQEPDF